MRIWWEFFGSFFFCEVLPEMKTSVFLLFRFRLWQNQRGRPAKLYSSLSVAPAGLFPLVFARRLLLRWATCAVPATTIFFILVNIGQARSNKRQVAGGKHPRRKTRSPQKAYRGLLYIKKSGVFYILGFLGSLHNVILSDTGVLHGKL